MNRNATAIWQGAGKAGKGTLSTQSKVLNNAPYSYKTRFGDGIGTNPEELIAAAHAGCFTMQLTFDIDGAGFTATELNTSCSITLENGAVTKSQLTLSAVVPGISMEKFNELVTHAEKNCPISKLLNTEITVEATLNP
jgi:osmotically inducible protein OsmC